MCLADFWSDSKEESFSQSWETRTDSLPCDLPVFILKLSECKKVELSDAFLAAFVNYLVSINDTVLLYFQLNFIFTITTSLNSSPIVHNIHYPSLVLRKKFQQVKWS